MMQDTIIQGDNMDVLADIADDTFDLMATDPPYGLTSGKNPKGGFMGKAWDKAVPSVETWRECLRVLKPGAWAFIMCIPRQDCLARMIVNLEDAGFNVSFSSIFHTFATGFPKAGNVGKLLDKRGGNSTKWFGQWLRAWRHENGITQKEVAALFPSKTGGLTGCIANWELGLNVPTPAQFNRICQHFNLPFENIQEIERVVTGKDRTRSNIDNIPFVARGEFDRHDMPATPEAQAFEGAYCGMQLKPALEVVLVAMKPLSEKTYIDQALANGHGVSWLDAGRIPYKADDVYNKIGIRFASKNAETTFGQTKGKEDQWVKFPANEQGRFPPNLLCSGNVLDDGHARGGGKFKQTGKRLLRDNPVYGKPNTTRHSPDNYGDSGSYSRYFDLDAWSLKNLPESAQRTFPFMIVPKAGKREKNAGLDELETIEYKGDNECQGVNMAAVTLLKKVTSGSIIKWLIGESGKSIMAMFPKDSASIILTEINRIIESKILPSLISSLTSESTQDANLETGNGGSPAVNAGKLKKWLLITTKGDLELARGASRVALKVLLQIRNEEEWKPLANRHSTVKPIKLMSWLIAIGSQVDDIVLDPFCGSGTTCIAAAIADRRYIGVDTDEYNCDISRRRIAWHIEQMEEAQPELALVAD